jgi:PTS system fructose-specific IIC component
VARLASKVDSEARLGTRIRQWLMTGVSYMIPFVAAGGILIALGFMLAQLRDRRAGRDRDRQVRPDRRGRVQHHGQNFTRLQRHLHWAALLFVIGAAAFGFLVPILSGFIAYRHRRPARPRARHRRRLDRRRPWAPASSAAWSPASSAVSSPAGSPAGRCTRASAGHAGRRHPAAVDAHHGGLFITVLGRPIKALMDALSDALNGHGVGTSAIALGLILGAMMGFDLGGPVNKVAYAFATTGLAAAGTATDSPAAQDHGGGHGRRHGRPARHGAGHHACGPKLFTEPERRTARRPGCSVRPSSPKVPSRSPLPTRIRVIASSVVGSAVTGGARDGLRHDLTRPTRRHLGAPAHRQLPALPRRARHRCLVMAVDRRLPQAARPQPRRRSRRVTFGRA